MRVLARRPGRSWAGIAVVALSLFAAACGPTGPSTPAGPTWSSFRFGASRSGAAPSETTINTATVGHLTVGWTGATTGPIDSSPAIAGGVAYVGSADGKLYAFSASGVSGCTTTPAQCTPLWTAATGGPIVSSPAVTDGVVYVGSADGKLYAFDANGVLGCTASPRACAPLWSATTTAAVNASPIVSGGAVYVTSQDGTLWAFDAAGSTGCSGTPKTCTALWTAPTGAASTGLGSSPAVAGGVVYIGSGDGRLWAFDAAGSTGCAGSPKVCTALWSTPAGTGGASTPAVSGGTVYLAAGSTLSAFDAAGSTGCAGTPVVCQAEWTAPLGGSTPSSPAVAAGLVYVASGSSLRAFDAAGAQACGGSPVVCQAVWSGSTGNTLSTSSPAVADGVVYVGSDDSNLYAFDAAGFDGCVGIPRSCTPIWSGSTAGALTSSAAVESGRVYIGSRDDRLYAFAPCTNVVSAVGLAPCDLTSAYHLPTLAGSATKTVAVVDAFDDPTAESDLAVYRSTFHLPPCTTANGCFTKVNQTGQQSNYPATDTGWSLEISLDLDMVSATCPLCHIVLAESNDDSFDNLAATQNMVAGLHPTVISDSFGGAEFSGEAAMDANFVHPGIQTVVASGDDGFPAGAQYPAVIPSVTAVGGTTLSYTGSGRGWSETVWNATPGNPTPTAAGSGCSVGEPKPAWQHDVGCTGRTESDVSAAANDLAVFDTTGQSGWVGVQGTSASAPIVASIWAITGSTAGVGSLYANTGSLYDVLSGSNGPGCVASYLCNGAAGYDGPTGLGSPCGLAAFGGTSPVGCGGSASASAGLARPALVSPTPAATAAAIEPVCAEPAPGHARCFAWVPRRR